MESIISGERNNRLKSTEGRRMKKTKAVDKNVKTKKAHKKGKKNKPESLYKRKPKHQSLEWSDLMTASYLGDIGWANSILRSDIDINHQDENGDSVLIIACRQGHTEMVQLLISKHVEVNMQKKNGKTALMKASKHGHVEIVRLLLDKGALVNLRSENGKSALMMAGSKGHTDIVKMLLEKSADVDMQEQSYGESALMMASENGHYDVVKELLDKGAQVNLRDSLSKETPLFKACSKDHPRVVKLLIRHGAEVDTQNESRSTPLMEASYYNHSKVVKLLLKKGANPNMRDAEGESPLIKSCTNSDPEVSEILIKKGAEINAQTNEGVTALMESIDYRNPKVTKLLLEYKADVNLFNNEGKTALIIACEEDCAESAELLLRYGADVNMQSFDNELSSLMIACDYAQTEMVLLLLEHGAKTDIQTSSGISSMILATQSQSTNALSLMLQQGAQVDIQDSEGLTPLMIASKLGLREITDLLIEYGASINLPDREGKSALIHATSNGHSELAIFMIELGAEINSQDNNGWFPLMYAVNDRDLEAVQILVACGAKLHMKNSEDQTIFDVCPQELLNDPLFQELLQNLLSTKNDNLKLDSNYPGVVFYGSGRGIKRNEEAGCIIMENMGITVSIAEDELKKPEEFNIRPCFSGPFELPDEYESASPAYLIHHDKMDLQKDVTIRMHHYASLQSEEDCEDMAFLSASSTPEYRGARPVYTFKEIQGAKGVFRPGDQVGEITLRHFSFWKTARTKKRKGECYYSARMYRNIKHQGQVSAVFCMCLADSVYTEHCDKVIAKDFAGMSAKGEGCSHRNAQMLGEAVEIHATQPTEFHVTYDNTPAQIKKREIHQLESKNMKVSNASDYPPKLQIYAHQKEPSIPTLERPSVQVNGLDIECNFNMIPLIQALPSVLQQQSFMSDSTDSATGFSLSPIKTSASIFAVKTPSPSASIHFAESKPVSEFTIKQKGCDGTMLAAVDESELAPDDLADVWDAVESLSPQWKLLATKLRIKPSSLDIIQHNHPGNAVMCLYEALGEWLRLNYDHQRHGRPSWRRLVEAVRTLDGGLSERIAEIYYTV